MKRAVKGREGDVWRGGGRTGEGGAKGDREGEDRRPEGYMEQYKEKCRKG